ncbi:MAG: CCA tRNA nucleotidyltransferase [Acidobacteriota bacterium]|nr:CCA tRNA nucleotidyltransferase [Acidobacteriota bacterium]
MADYIYLLENRLSGAQQSTLRAIREIAQAKGLTLFLVGGAVRDLTSGSPVRDLDVAVQGNALKLRKDLEKAGAQISGEHEPMQALFLRLPGNVRVEISSTLSVHYPKPGKPVVRPASILEDLRRRDFTANAMALSLNEGSYGLLMDPLNGVADIENRELRLVSSYGFIEDPIRMVRAARLGARLGWQMEERTLARYETGKSEGYISAASEFQRGYELEEIVHEEDPLRVLSRLESEGWMKILFPGWNSGKANLPELEKLRDAQAQLQMQGVHADASAAQFPLVTARLSPKEVASLKKSFPRHGFVDEIDALESEAKQLGVQLLSKQAATPSAAWKMIFSAPPEVVLWAAYSTRSAALQAKFRSFYTEWPTARQRIPYVLMQEMRIVPDLPGYGELVERLFFELMDGRLGTPEEMKAFLEPHSPPAPPPPVHLRRARAAKAVRPPKGKKKPEAEAEGEAPDAASEIAPHPLAAADNNSGRPKSTPAETQSSSASIVPAKAAKAASGKAAPSAKASAPGPKPSASSPKASASGPKASAPGPKASASSPKASAPAKQAASSSKSPAKAAVKAAAPVPQKRPAKPSPVAAKKAAPAKAAGKSPKPQARPAAKNSSPAKKVSGKSTSANKSAAKPAKGAPAVRRGNPPAKSVKKAGAKTGAKPTKVAGRAPVKPAAKRPAKPTTKRR